MKVQPEEPAGMPFEAQGPDRRYQEARKMLTPGQAGAQRAAPLHGLGGV